MGWFVLALCMLYVAMGIGVRVLMEPVLRESEAQTITRLLRPGAGLIVILLWPLVLLSAASFAAAEAFRPTPDSDSRESS